LRNAILKRLAIAADELVGYTIFRRGHDARKPSAIAFIYTLDVELNSEAAILKRLRGDRHVGPDAGYLLPLRGPGAGHRPAGATGGDRQRPLWPVRRTDPGADGFRPLILERGKAVRERTQDTWGLWRKGQLNPESNVQFGEGGAGTFSDGKLYSQIKRSRSFRGARCSTEFVAAGAPAEILYVSKPRTSAPSSLVTDG
jgi:uncharacterized FAD-dependent dehydrogenase